MHVLSELPEVCGRPGCRFSTCDIIITSIENNNCRLERPDNSIREIDGVCDLRPTKLMIDRRQIRK